MKHDINEVAKTIAKEISKLEANTIVDHGTFHHTMKLTKRESEARKMAGWFLLKVEKMISEDDKEIFSSLQNQLIELAIAEVGK
jgi:orotidine-5'-phosphate decarboxylase